MNQLFWHDFTLFVINIILPFPTPFDHFHFQPTLELKSRVMLRSCLLCSCTGISKSFEKIFTHTNSRPLKTSKCSFFWPFFNLAPSLCSFCSLSDLLQPVIFLNSIHFSVPCSVPWPVFQIQADGWEWSNFLQETAMVHPRPQFGCINLVNHKCGHKINNVRAAESSRFYWKIRYLPIK